MMKQNNNIPKGYKDSPLGIIPEEWEVKRFSELFSFKNGINSDKESYGKGIKFVNTMDVLNTQYLTYELIRGSVVVDKVKMNEFVVQYGDILFNRTSETPNEIGYSTVYLDTINVVFGGFIIRAKCVDHSIDHRFKMYCFKTNSVRKQIVSFGNGAIRYNLGQEDLAKTQIALPPLPEQQKIAEISDIQPDGNDNTHPDADGQRDGHNNQQDGHTGPSLPIIVQWFKTMTTNEYIRGVKSNGWPPFHKKLWQRNYYEHIIRDERAYQNISDYIIRNPASWERDSLK